VTIPVLQTASLSVPTTASTTTYGTQFQFVAPKQTDYVVVLATLLGVTGGTLDIVIQESWDSGTTWDDVAHFTQLAGGAAATSWRLVVGAQLGKATATVVGTVGTAVPVLVANTFADGPWAPTLRIVSTTGSGTSGSAALQSFIFVPVLKLR
jgi:hypothetical protein